MHVQTYGIKQAAGHDFQGGYVLLIGTAHLRANVAYMALYVPYALPCPALVPEYLKIARIRLRVVRAHKGQQGGFSRSVLPCQGPALPFPDRPTQILQDDAGIVSDGNIVEFEDDVSFLGVIESVG